MGKSMKVNTGIAIVSFDARLSRRKSKVEHHPGLVGALDETYTQSKIDISESNETMQNALASIV